MGVHVEKASLTDPMHLKQLKCERDSVMARVASKMPRSATLDWDMDVEPQDFDVRRVEHVQVTTAQLDVRTSACGKMASGQRSHQAVVSRKRRLPEAVRPTKCFILSSRTMKRLALRVCEAAEPNSVENADGVPVKVSRPRSLHFALPGLSSHETQLIFAELVSVRHELSWLNGSLPSDATIHPVFGWRAAVWDVPTPQGNDAFIYKAAKAFEGVPMHSIARRLWAWRGSAKFPELGAPKHEYVIADGIRIVRQKDRLHGRVPHTSLWLECIRDLGDSVFFVRKELHRFKDTVSGHESRSERECHGYILHPLLVPMGSQIIAGTALHSMGSFRTRGRPIQDQIQHVVDDLPRHVLQWEDSFVHVTSPL